MHSKIYRREVSFDMTKVITYGTYDLLHYGHIKLLERARALGDYLIVGVTADDFDRKRGKLNVQQTLIERIEAVRATGLADEIIVEEYEGQKIDDIKRFEVDIFTVGSDWVGQFDYLNEFCKVVYLERTQGVSSTELRSRQHEIRIGLVGESRVINKFAHESQYINGIRIVGVCTKAPENLNAALLKLPLVTASYPELLEHVDAVYILSHPSKHYRHIKAALEKKIHVLYESPMALSLAHCKELQTLSRTQDCVLSEGIKTAYSIAYNRLILLAKSGKIGDILSVEAVCTSLQDIDYSDTKSLEHTWNSMTAWAPTALLPVFQLLGTQYTSKQIISKIGNEEMRFDKFSRLHFIYPTATASVLVGKGIKSEGHLIISGTKGYIYVPAPWWKTEYFELRYENPQENRRYFYQLDGEGIRYEILAFARAIDKKQHHNIASNISEGIVQIMEAFVQRKDCLSLDN